MARQQHNNPWVEKLLQVSLPDSGEAWRAMESRLDAQMPRWRNRDRRRWVLLILLLLLLIGVCNCPGRDRLFRGSATVNRQLTPLTPAANAHIPVAAPAATAHTPLAAPAAPANDLLVSAAGSQVLAAGRIIPGPTHPARITMPASVQGQTPTTQASTGDNIDTTTTAHASIADSAGKKAGPGLKKNAAAKDSGHKKPPPPPKQTEQKEKENGWMAAIGLNQFFPLGGQQSAYNSDGTSGTLSDYIPVPVLRYYFNRKLYVQLEAQINTPQATKKNLVISAPPPDTSTLSGQRIASSASIQRLFYFNVPLSIHYTVFDHLDIGTGLQFSRLTNAIGSFDTTITPAVIVNGPALTTVSSKAVKSFKGDALYQQIKSDEVRFLLDMSYTYQHVILGLRYNQALSKFVDIQVAPGQIAQGRNSSLQLYGRYILWDGRKKRNYPAK